MTAAIISALFNSLVTIAAHWWQSRHTSAAVAKAAQAVADTPTDRDQFIAQAQKGNL